MAGNGFWFSEVKKIKRAEISTLGLTPAQRRGGYSTILKCWAQENLFSIVFFFLNSSNYIGAFKQVPLEGRIKKENCKKFFASMSCIVPRVCKAGTVARHGI